MVRSGKFGINAKLANGFVLVMTLLMVVVITTLGLTLISGALLEHKISQIAEEKEIALHHAIAGDHQFFHDALTGKLGDQNPFIAFAKYSDPKQYMSDHGAISTISWGSDLHQATDCPHSKLPTQGMQCAVLQVSTIKYYGKGNARKVQVISGVVQELGIY